MMASRQQGGQQRSASGRFLTDRHFTLTGWWLFVASAALFIVSAWRAGDMVALAGALAFMAANISFLVPFYRPGAREGVARDKREE
jgi:protein-S-isoprenylcysteine O-methyltransferase Ste14